MVNIDVNVKNHLIRVVVKKVVCGILVHVIANTIKRVKLVGEYLYIKSCACKERVIDK